MNVIRYTLAMTGKEIQVMLRDRGSLAIMFLLPLLLGVMFGGINLMMSRAEEAEDLLTVLLVNEDAGPFGTEVAKAIESIEQVDVESYDTLAPAEELVAKGEAAAVIVIPGDFSGDIDAYTATSIEVIVDPGQPESASIVTGIMNQVVAEVTIWGEVQYGIRTVLDESGVLAGATAEQRRGVEAQTLGAIMTVLNEMRSTPVVDVVSEDLAGAAVEGGIEQFFALLFPGFTVLFVFFGASWSSTALLQERESGTLRRLLAAPISRGAAIAGKMLAFMILAWAQTAALLGIGSGFFGMPVGQAPVALIVLTVVVSLCATALGMMIASLARSADQAGNIGTLLGFVLGGIGGCIPAFSPTPIIRSGGMLGTLAALTPQGHAVDAFYTLMAENGSFGDILIPMAIVLVMGLVFYGVAIWRFRFE